MRKVQQTLTDFSAGEISRKFDGRFDLAIYRKGCAKLENFLIMNQGGATFRPGTMHVAEVKTSGNKTRLVAFVRSAAEVYLLEFGNLYFRVYLPYERSGSVEVVTPYPTADLFELKFLQIDDDLWIVHPAYQPREITYTDATTWAIAVITFLTVTFNSSGDYPRAIAFYQNRVWLADTDNDPSTIWASKEGNYKDFGVSSPVVAGDSLNFQAIADKKRNVLWMEADSHGITVGTLLGEGVIYPNGDGVISAIGLPNFKWMTAYGSADIQGKLFNKEVMFIQHGHKYLREFFTKNDLTSRADHIFGTDEVVEFEYIQSPYPSIWVVRGDGEIACLAYNAAMKVFAWFRIVTDGLVESLAVVPRGTKDEIWLIVNRTINGGTKRYIEYLADFETEDQEDAHHVDCGTFYDGGTDDVSAVTAETVQDITGITAANPAVVTCAGHGYNNGDTVRIDNVVGMIELNGREFTVAGAAADTFQLSGEDSSLYAAYSSGGNVVETPNVHVTMDTALVTLGWANTDHVYFRDIGGMTELNERRFEIEGVSGSDFDIDTLDLEDYTAYTSGGTAEKVVNEVTSLDHINGEEAAILADGGTHARKTVASNKALLDDYYNKVHVGLSYEGLIKTMRVVAGKPLQKKRIVKVLMRLFKTLGVSVGPDEDNLKNILFRSGSDPMGSPPALYTGDKEALFPGNWTKENYIVVKHTDPTPMSLVALGAELLIGGK